MLTVTTQQMRKSVRDWLVEENATIEQALMLQAALEAGAVAGEIYVGNRRMGNEPDSVAAVDKFQQSSDDVIGTDDGLDDEDGSCGCLLDTFERIQDDRPDNRMGPAAARTFGLALMIGIGDTPRNSRWAAAAVRGIQEYVALVESGEVVVTA